MEFTSISLLEQSFKEDGGLGGWVWGVWTCTTARHVSYSIYIKCYIYFLFFNIFVPCVILQPCFPGKVRVRSSSRRSQDLWRRLRVGRSDMGACLCARTTPFLQFHQPGASLSVWSPAEFKFRKHLFWRYNWTKKKNRQQTRKTQNKVGLHFDTVKIIFTSTEFLLTFNTWRI